VGPRGPLFCYIEDGSVQKIDEITELIRPVLEQMNIELVEAQLHGSGNRTMLRIYVDEPGGISLKRCATVSRQISDILDRKDPIKSRYILQVSSPGLDRPIKTIDDFKRNVGQKVHIEYMEKEKHVQSDARIIKIQDDRIEFEIDGRTVILSMNEIVTVKPVIEFN
jgi:ribosome maturation factor RimP